MLGIGLDLDGVIADIQSEFVIRLNRDFQIDADPSKWETHYVHDQFPEVPNDWVEKQFADPTFWLNAKCYEDAWMMTNKWFMTGHDVYIITCRNDGHGPLTIETTERWLLEWEIPYNKLLHSQTRLEKYEVALEYDLNFMVEDDDHEADVLGQHVKTYLLDHPYNRKYNGKFERISSLREIDIGGYQQI
jgi:5'(3')-deoxyribonucleotidase